MAKKKAEFNGLGGLKYDDININKHTPAGLKMLKNSVLKLGFGRSILVDKNNMIIAGNGVTKTAEALGVDKIKFIDTTWEELIAIRDKVYDRLRKKTR